MKRKIVKHNGARAVARKTPKKTQERSLVVRGYREVISVGGQNQDWMLQSLSEDADLWQNAYALTARVDDLFRTNPLYIKYRESFWSGIYGSDGIMLRMKVLETENRIVYASDEKAALVAHETRINRLREWAAKRDGREPEQYRAFKLADVLDKRDFDSVLRGTALVEVGQSDVRANQLIEAARAEWQRAEFSDLRGTKNYFTHCLLRSISAIKHGDVFIRMIKDPGVNKFGFALHLIAGQWCDRFLNCTLGNGNVIRMGIEYLNTVWGIGKPVAYYFITRVPQDWQYTPQGMFTAQPGPQHQRVDASEIIHYARPVDAESTRPAPWVASTIPKARQLDQAMLAEVIAWRESACKTGYLWSDVNPEGGMSGAIIDPKTGLATNQLAPGETGALPWGVKYQQNNPTHPNANVEQFRKSAVRDISAGMPTADYNTLANDLENINFSAGRLGRLDTNEMSKLIQRFDIDCAERPIFENWLEMALITGAIPLPFTKTKFSKFNKPVFQGRRWQQVDETKAVNAAALRVANLFSSDQRECAELGSDLEEILFEQAESNMLKEQLGLPTLKTVEQPPKVQEDPSESGEEDEAGKKPSPKKKPVKASNGSHELETVPRI